MRRVRVGRSVSAGLFDGGNKTDRAVDAMCVDGLPRTAKIGILGGGQLGRMLAIAGAPMGVRVLSLDPNPDSPASLGGAIATVGSFTNNELFSPPNSVDLFILNEKLLQSST